MITYSLNASTRDSSWGLCPRTRENTSSWMTHFKKWEDTLKMGLRTVFFFFWGGGLCYNYSNFIFLFTDKNIKVIFRISFVSLLLLPATCLSVPLTQQWALQGCRCESIFIWKMFLKHSPKLYLVTNCVNIYGRVCSSIKRKSIFLL